MSGWHSFIHQNVEGNAPSIFHFLWSDLSNEQSSSSALAKIVFVHGFSDHCNAYHDLFLNLALARIEVHAFDQRGWGRSVKTVSERGLTGPTSQVLDDITSILKSQLPTSVPLFLMGHSMGGAEVLVSSFTRGSRYPHVFVMDALHNSKQNMLIAVDKFESSALGSNGSRRN